MDNEEATSVEQLRARARAWAPRNLPRRGEWLGGMGGERVRAAQHLQQLLFDAGFAGVTWPRAYGGQGLTVQHLRALDEEFADYQTPYMELSVSVGIIGPTILEFGTEDQKATHLPPILRGDRLWVQYLSEPTGGSDMAGVTTRAARQGDSWILNGSKVWTTFGQYADYAVCLARTDWSKPKHRGLSMFVVKVDSPGLSVYPLRQASGESEFCQEFLEDVVVPADALLGAEDDGWTVASRLLVHERTALGGGSPYFSLGRSGETRSQLGRRLAAEAMRAGTWVDPVVRDAVAEAHVSDLASAPLAERVTTAMALGHLQGSGGSILKLFSATADLRRTEVALAVLGPSTIAWEPGDERSRTAALAFVGRQGGSLLGGSDEIQRNIISERVLGLPREHTPDRDVPFEQVRRNQPPTLGRP